MRIATSRTPSTLIAIAIVSVALGVIAPATPAQCFGPDGLDLGPCCASVVPNLPAFPGATLPSLGICWASCTLSGTQDLNVQWTPPSQVTCGEYISQLSVVDAGSGAPILSGTLILDYTRTWEEIDPSGVPIQVWRFVAKADISAVAGGAISPCVVPSCNAPIGPHPTSYYYGYVDYTSCAAAGPWQNTLVLYHACDRYVHTPGLSDRPGVFHPDLTFAIVAPHSTLQPFVPSDATASSGVLIGEATRNMSVPGVPPSFCVVEDRVVNGSLQKLGAGCLCTLTQLPKHQTFREFRGQTACVNAAGIPGGWNSMFVLFPTIPWIHLVSSSIGSWTSPSVYPGTERVWADEGLFLVQDACTGDFVEIKYGASTRGGFMIDPTTGLSTDFTDLADNFSAPLSGPFTSAAFGSVQPTDHLVYVNSN